MKLGIIDIATGMANDLHNHTEIVSIEIGSYLLAFNVQWKRLTAVLRRLKCIFDFLMFYLAADIVGTVGQGFNVLVEDH